MTPGDNNGDDELFLRTLADAVPLKRRRPQPPEGQAKSTTKKPVAKRAPSPKKAAVPVSSITSFTRLSPFSELVAGDYARVDRRTADRFRRGKVPIEARLDLHGLYQGAAHDALTHFITECAAQGKRCVLVITGRGSREGSGVLRERLPQWLNQPPVRGYVLAFTFSRPQHGGYGAVYVLLKRKRDDKS
ncbi:MAG TPA: hypothetical protein DIT35_01485 [Rhodospirillaceae bacterium]|nr:hypothetical protein [Rhodospirillaceae bacterium]